MMELEASLRELSAASARLSHRSTSPPSAFNSERPRKDSNSWAQAITDDSSKPTNELCLGCPVSSMYDMRQNSNAARFLARATAPALHKSLSPHSLAFGTGDSRSNGGHTHPPGDGSSGSWGLSSKSVSNVQSASTCQGSRRFSSTTPLNSALSNSMGESDTRSQGSLCCQRRNVPDSPAEYMQPLPDFKVPDITREIHNKSLVAIGGYSLVFRADRKKSQGSSNKVGSRVLSCEYLGPLQPFS
ncbi:hypothetical protein BS47DRAFT_154795 [Hydnum rufescens UP504]|uniref:Uncharacterized protein n=1 Tax=Hydnum rufescens UP504 TaxID=1448309 RepID=A0A9P6DSC9_9AGAM|nr:hypothetical protein BS47DRAFT_154795 [Hydnum rufescens UP504]